MSGNTGPGQRARVAFFNSRKNFGILTLEDNSEMQIRSQTVRKCGISRGEFTCGREVLVLEKKDVPDRPRPEATDIKLA